MVCIENPAGVAVEGCRLLAAGHSAVDSGVGAA